MIEKILKSWNPDSESINGTYEILDWIKELNRTVFVDIKKIPLSDCCNWFYDKNRGIIRNESNSFFQIAGCRCGSVEQPVIIQDEIGYLGILCKELNGVLYFLMQAKIEPGNINKIQLSPTIQATKSNFTQKHGGRKPAYIDYFINAGRHNVVVDQIQSEQSSRFLKKRNRNIIVMLPDGEEVEVLPSHKWMTLWQIKELMKYDNLVNMDTRTVISCIPYSQVAVKEEFKSLFADISMFNSIFIESGESHAVPMYSYINDYKMFNEIQPSLMPLDSLSDWSINDTQIECKHPYPFKVIFCDISIEGREVSNWKQPLFEAIGKAFFGLFTTIHESRRLFLTKMIPEIGCFDRIEIGPSVQLEAGYKSAEISDIDKIFLDKFKNNEGILHNVILSEEGGRFYHEQNHNAIIEINKEELTLPDGYFWADFRTLNKLTQVNNCLNIQLRNLLSLLKI